VTNRRSIDSARRRHDDYPVGLQPVPRTALTLDEAAASAGVSLSHFRRHILPDLRVIYSGNVRLVPLAELAQWADKQARLAGAA
jgi:hypothetical protein